MEYRVIILQQFTHELSFLFNHLRIRGNVHLGATQIGVTTKWISWIQGHEFPQFFPHWFDALLLTCQVEVINIDSEE